jgi:phage tail-like protein
MAPTKSKPYLNARFRVEIGSLVVAGFSDVSGLQVELETEDYREGGRNDFVHKLPKVIKCPNLILKRGVTDSDVLWKWHQEAVTGKINRMDGSIILCDLQGNDKVRWEFFGAYPIKWSGPEFKADGSVVAVESLELVHWGIKKK